MHGIAANHRHSRPPNRRRLVLGLLLPGLALGGCQMQGRSDDQDVASCRGAARIEERLFLGNAMAGHRRRRARHRRQWWHADLAQPRGERHLRPGRRRFPGRHRERTAARQWRWHARTDRRTPRRLDADACRGGPRCRSAGPTCQRPSPGSLGDAGVAAVAEGPPAAPQARFSLARGLPVEYPHPRHAVSRLEPGSCGDDRPAGCRMRGGGGRRAASDACWCLAGPAP